MIEAMDKTEILKSSSNPPQLLSQNPGIICKRIYNER